MRRTGFLVAIALFALGGCQRGGEEGAWQKFTHLETEFSVLFPPGEPSDSFEAIPSDLGPIDSFVVELKPAGDTLTYQVHVHNFPPAAIRIVQGTANLMVARQRKREHDFEAKRLSEEHVTLGETPGRAFRLEMPDGTVEISRLYMVDTVMYMATVVAPAAEQDRPEVAKFLDSLELPEAKFLQPEHP
jgi:hypothetical protein